MDEEIQNTFI